MEGMKQMLPHFASGNVFTVVVSGQSYQFTNEHPNFKGLFKAIKDNDGDTFLELFKNKSVVNTTTTIDKVGGITLTSDGKVYYQGQELHNNIVESISNLQKEGLDSGPMMLFLNKLYQNVSNLVQKTLPDFIKYDGLTISSNGNLVGYKAVRNNWWDKWTGNRHHNVIGSTQVMDRGQVCDDPRNGCAPGLHVGSLNFVAGYGCGDDHIIIVEVDPRDIVCIPYDSSNQKMRVCQYKVMSEYTGKLKSVLFDGKEVNMPAKIEEYDWDEVEDEEDEDDVYDDYDSYDDDEDEDYDEDEENVVPYHNVRDSKGRFTKRK